VSSGGDLVKLKQTGSFPDFPIISIKLTEILTTPAAVGRGKDSGVIAPATRRLTYPLARALTVLPFDAVATSVRREYSLAHAGSVRNVK
jgi:hypothetical protein